jgi:hypothetical protein
MTDGFWGHIGPKKVPYEMRVGVEEDKGGENLGGSMLTKIWDYKKPALCPQS